MTRLYHAVLHRMTRLYHAVQYRQSCRTEPYSTVSHAVPSRTVRGVLFPAVQCVPGCPCRTVLPCRTKPYSLAVTYQTVQSGPVRTVWPRPYSLAQSVQTLLPVVYRTVPNIPVGYTVVYRTGPNIPVGYTRGDMLCTLLDTLCTTAGHLLYSVGFLLIMAKPCSSWLKRRVSLMAVHRSYSSGPFGHIGPYRSIWSYLGILVSLLGTPAVPLRTCTLGRTASTCTTDLRVPGTADM